jgi:hypothetical protein
MFKYIYQAAAARIGVLQVQGGAPPKIAQIPIKVNLLGASFSFSAGFAYLKYKILGQFYFMKTTHIICPRQYKV